MGNSNCFQSSDDEEDDDGVVGPTSDEHRRVLASTSSGRSVNLSGDSSDGEFAYGSGGIGDGGASTQSSTPTFDSRFTNLEQQRQQQQRQQRQQQQQQQQTRRPVVAATSAPSGDTVRSRPHQPSVLLSSRRPEAGSAGDEEEEARRLRLAQRMGFIYQLPTGVFDGSKKARECAICMLDFEVGEHVRYLPCMHAYHQGCIDDWLLRSFTCPSCMQPVDAALLSSFGCPDD